MKSKVKHLILKLEALLPMELALSISYNGCLVIFTGKISGTVHFTFLKEHEEEDVTIQPRLPSELDIPLVTPLKYAEPLDELSARRARAKVDLLIMEMMQTRELAEIKRVARETFSDQEDTLKVA